MPTITARDGTTLYYRDWGTTGQPVVFSHGWPLTGDAFEDQMFFLSSRGYRCIAHDRRGHGLSGQSWHGNNLDTYADDLADLVTHLELKNAVHRAFIMAEDVVELDLAGLACPAVEGECLRVPIGTPLAEMERQAIFATLDHCRGNKRRAAEMLGVSLKTLYNRLTAYQADGARLATL